MRLIVNAHGCHTALNFGVKAKENQDMVPTLNWLPKVSKGAKIRNRYNQVPHLTQDTNGKVTNSQLYAINKSQEVSHKLHKTPYKARIIAKSNSFTTTELSKLLTSCLTAVKRHVIKYCEKVYERLGKNIFWSIKKSGEILDNLKARDFNATSLSTYDFSTPYTTLPHNLIKDKLIDLIERTFQREGSPYLACNDRNAFFTSEKPKRYHSWSCQNVCDALTFLLDNIFIRFCTKLYRQVAGIPMGTNCAPLVVDLFLFCYERDFMRLILLMCLTLLLDNWRIF